MKKVKFVTEVMPLDVLLGINDRYIVIGTSSEFTMEVFNINTWEEQTIEGDYLAHGNVEHLDLENCGTFDQYIKQAEQNFTQNVGSSTHNDAFNKRQQRLKNKVEEIKNFYELV